MVPRGLCVSLGLLTSVASLQSPVSSFRTLLPPSATATADIRIEASPIAFFPQAENKGGAAACLKEAGYNLWASISVDSDGTKYVLASGSADEWLDLTEMFEGVKVYEPTRKESPEQHDVIGYFAKGIGEAALVTHLENLAYARDHASNIRGHDVIACAFISLSEIEENELDSILVRSQVKKIADDRGIVIFGGEVLGLVANFADERTRREAVETSLAEEKKRRAADLKAKDVALEAAEKEARELRARLAKLEEAKDDPDDADASSTPTR